MAVSPLSSSRLSLVSANKSSVKTQSTDSNAVASSGGWFSGSLANGGEKLILEDANSKILTSFEYDDKGAWPSQADGNGSSLELINPLSSASVPSNWKPSVRPGGTPGD